MKNFVITIFILLLLAGGYLLFKAYTKPSNVPSTATTAPTASGESSTENESLESEVVITYTNSGFSPANATVKSGSKLVWENKSDRAIQVGADPHPIHTGNRELVGGGFVLSLSPGEKKVVTVTKKGTFGYHNHLRPSDTGTITVE